jgi:hypothetical protein
LIDELVDPFSERVECLMTHSNTFVGFFRTVSFELIEFAVFVLIASISCLWSAEPYFLHLSSKG